jgi:hypothetical protein
MKKTFPLQVPGRDRARVLDSIKYDVRKYVQRERNKLLPDGFEIWNFECRVGSEPSAAVVKSLKEISPAIDEVAGTGGTSVYVEIIAVPAHRAPP